MVTPRAAAAIPPSTMELGIWCHATMHRQLSTTRAAQNPNAFGVNLQPRRLATQPLQCFDCVLRCSGVLMVRSLSKIDGGHHKSSLSEGSITHRIEGSIIVVPNPPVQIENAWVELP